MPQIDLSILNQRQTPAFYADVLANRPAAGFIGRIFVSTNTFEFYRDNGTGWDIIGGPGAGTVTGGGSLYRVAIWNSTSSIGESNNLIFDFSTNRLGIGTNAPGTALDVHSTQSTILQLNQTSINDTRIAFQLSGAALWRIGNFYNGGANDFELFDVIGAQAAITVKKTSGQVLIGTSTVGSGKLVVASATGDNGVQIVGASAPSLRIDNAASGPTKRAGLGISTAVNNFIQGSADRDFCIFNGSTTASPMLFGIYDAGLTNVQEAGRFSAARNFLIGTTTDAGQKLQVVGTSRFSDFITIDGFVNGVSNSKDIRFGGGSYIFLKSDGLLQLSGNANSIETPNGIRANTITNTVAFQFGDVTFNKGAGVDTTVRSSGQPLRFQAANTFNIQLQAGGGNVLIGTTTDAGFRLDVNGTARVQTNFAVGSGYTPNFQSGETINTNGRIRAEGGITFRSAASGDILGPGIFANGGTGQAGLNFFCGGALTSTMNFIGGGTGNVLQIGASQFTSVATGTSTQLNIVPTYNPNVPTTVTFKGIYYSGNITAPGNFNGAHIGIQIENGDSLFNTSSGSVGIGATATINASSILQVTSTTKGFLPPRMTTAQKNAIGTPATGLMVYDTTLNKLAVFTGVNWETITSL